MNKKIIRHIFHAGNMKIRGTRKELKIVFEFDAVTGKLVRFYKPKQEVKGIQYPIRKQEYKQLTKKLFPKRPLMTQEEKVISHRNAVKRHRKNKRKKSNDS